MSNLTTSGSNEASHVSCSSNRNESVGMLHFPPPLPIKKKRNQPGRPDPDAEVIALSPRTLMATNRYVCEICKKGFQREQNLQLHKRGHNLPWTLKQRSSSKLEIIKKKVYVCPETSCVHHDPSRALGDLTGVKKHFSRKHGEKKWKCEKCSKKYAVQSDWKAHSKTCGTRDYKCDHCGTIFSRRDSFITHRAFCDALPVETTINRSSSINHVNNNNIQFQSQFNINHINKNAHDHNYFQFPIKKDQQPQNFNLPPNLDHLMSTQYPPPPSPFISATALLQKAQQIGASRAQIHAHVSAHHQNMNMNMNMNSLSSSSCGNKIMTTGASTADHMMMMMNQIPHPPPHDQISSGFYDHEDSYNFDATINGHEFSSTVRNEEETTRDFLGLRPLNMMMTQSDHILLSSMAAAAAAPGFCNQNQKSDWQG